MANQKITFEVLVNTTTGSATARQVSGGGQSASSASDQRESRRSGGSNDFASQVAGKPVYGGHGSGVPFFMDPTNTLGSSIRTSMDAALNPFLSGGQQKSILETQAARAAAYTPFGLASGGAAALGFGAQADKFDQLGRAISDLVASLKEKVDSIKSMTSGAAVNEVNGIVDQYSAQGISLPPEMIKRLYEQSEARQQRIVRGRIAVAEASGNATAQDTVALMQRISDLEAQLPAFIRSYPGVEKSLDDARRLAEAAQRGMNAAGIGNGGLPTHR